MPQRTVEVQRDIRAERQAAADAFRATMTRQGTLVVRLLSSPGSGKTTLLEHTAKQLGQTQTIGILVGDVETERDAERLAPYAPSSQITTGGACHLEIPLIEKTLPKLGNQRFDILFLEDIGNLICPASHDLGEHLRVILLSTPEGDDKPGKYPKAFRTSDVLVISKSDLLPHVNFSVERAKQDALAIQPELTILTVSSFSGEGMDAWYELLLSKKQELRTGS
jgi:hydrogenase nickel incorporation protein HypB